MWVTEGRMVQAEEPAKLESRRREQVWRVGGPAGRRGWLGWGECRGQWAMEDAPRRRGGGTREHLQMLRRALASP